MPDTDNWSGNRSAKTALRKAAQGGDQDSIQVLLQQAVAHKGWGLTSEVRDHTLIISLQSSELPTQAIAVVLLCRELCTWKLSLLATVCIQGQIVAEQPEWSVELSFSDASSPLPSVDQIAKNGLIGHRHPEAFAPSTGVIPQANFWIALGQSLTTAEWRILGLGFGLAVVCYAFPSLRFLLSPLVTILHELGHAGTGWVFGYPSIPAFDFLYGGGVTFNWDRWSVLIGGIYAGFVYLLYRYRHNSRTSRALLLSLGVYTLCVGSGLDQLFMVAMGHGAELVFAGIFLFRGVSGVICPSAGERALYCAVGLFMVLYDLGFAQSLLLDPAVRAIYELGKGDVLDHDFVRLSRDFLNLPFRVVVAGFWLACWLPPTVVLFAHRYQPEIQRQCELFLSLRSNRDHW